MPTSMPAVFVHGVPGTARVWQAVLARRFGARLAERTGAQFVCIPGCSHWWQLERPDMVANDLLCSPLAASAQGARAALERASRELGAG
jgi:pimeloyl-ACP methyl ester carboxylesterase